MKPEVSVLCAAVILFTWNGHADSRLPFERSLSLGILTGVRLFMATNNSAPSQWRDLWATDVEAINKQLWEREQLPIQALYVFLTTNTLMLPSEKKVVVAPISPVKIDGKSGRYVVCQLPDGSVYDDWVTESEFQKALAQSGVTLPTPDPREVAAAKAAVERLMAREQVEHAMIVAAAPKPTWADIRAVWWLRLKGWFFVYSENGHFSGRPRPLGIFVALGLVALVIFGLRGKRT